MAWSDRKFDLRFSVRYSSMALAGIVLLAVVLRLVYFNGLTFSDDADYANRAHRLLIGEAHVYPDNNGFRIGTWAPAAVGYWIFGINHFGLVVYPLVMSILAVYLIYRLGSVLFDQPTGRVAALLLAFYPLDVELSTRLLPDSLLSSFSLLLVLLLLSSDLAWSAPSSGRLRGWRAQGGYFLSGVLLGWCTAVNMSAVVLVFFVGVYFFYSLTIFVPKMRALGWRSVLIDTVIRRYLFLVAGFVCVALVEGAVYYAEFGDAFVKYRGTLHHYNESEIRFDPDLWTYLRSMLFLNEGLRIHVPAPEYRPYGFYFVAALPCLVFCAVFAGRAGRVLVVWFLSVFLYLQWGTMSFSDWAFLHRLYRHLELVTPPLILMMAVGLVRLGRGRRFYVRPLVASDWPFLHRLSRYLELVTPPLIMMMAASLVRLGRGRRVRVLPIVAVVLLFATSVATIRGARANGALEQLAMRRIHDALAVLPPGAAFMDTGTLAQQRFFDRFQTSGREYLPLEYLLEDPRDDAIVVVRSSNYFGEYWSAGFNPHQPPENWELALEFPYTDDASRADDLVRVYRVLDEPLASIRAQRHREALRVIEKLRPNAMARGWVPIFAWEGRQVDGRERLSLLDRRLSSEHLEYRPPQGVSWSFLESLPAEPGWSYEVVLEQGRGSVTIEAQPAEGNGYTLTLVVDDRPPSWGAYRFFVVGRPPGQARGEPLDLGDVR